MKSFLKGSVFAMVVAGAAATASPAHALVNLALGKATSASSAAYGATALAVDGSTLNTYPNVFQSGPDVSPYWIVDLGASYTLNDIHIYQRNTAEDAGARELKNWTLILYGSGTLASPSTVVSQNTFNIDAPLTNPDVDVTTGVTGLNARFVQIILNTTSADYLSLAEVQVFQQAAAPSAVPEPATLMLALVGVAGAVVSRRRGASGRAA